MRRPVPDRGALSYLSVKRTRSAIERNGTGMKKDSKKQTGKSKREAKKVADMQSIEQLRKRDAKSLMIGMDVGDRTCSYCIRTAGREIILEGTVATKAEAIVEAFQGLKRQTVVIETGTHSRWIAQLLELLGHEVIVANARKLKMISENNQKSDKVDSRLLSELGCCNPNWLHGVYLRSEATQNDLLVARARQALVDVRTGLINQVRGVVKSFGTRLPKCSSEAFVEISKTQMPDALKAGLSGILETLEQLDDQIHRYDCQIEHLCNTKYQMAAKCLLQVKGVGPVTTLVFLLTIENKDRFERSREVGPYLGLVPKKRQSGERDPRLGITKEGDEMLRKLLVNCAHYILGANSQDSDLRRWGLSLVRAAERKGIGHARKLAAAAVARKLAVLLHRLWVTGAVYEPLRNSERQTAAAA